MKNSSIRLGRVPSWQSGNKGKNLPCEFCFDTEVPTRDIHGNKDPDHRAICEPCWDKHGAHLILEGWWPCGCGG